MEIDGIPGRLCSLVMTLCGSWCQYQHRALMTEDVNVTVVSCMSLICPEAFAARSLSCVAVLDCGERPPIMSRLPAAQEKRSFTAPNIWKSCGFIMPVMIG